MVQSQAESLIKLTFICFPAHGGSAAVHMLDAWPMLKDSRQVVEANHTVGFIASTHHLVLLPHASTSIMFARSPLYASITVSVMYSQFSG